MPHHAIVYHLTVTLSSLNSCMDPVVYCFVTNNFQVGLHAFIFFYHPSIHPVHWVISSSNRPRWEIFSAVQKLSRLAVTSLAFNTAPRPQEGWLQPSLKMWSWWPRFPLRCRETIWGTTQCNSSSTWRGMKRTESSWNATYKIRWLIFQCSATCWPMITKAVYIAPDQQP